MFTLLVPLAIKEIDLLYDKKKIPIALHFKSGYKLYMGKISQTWGFQYKIHALFNAKTSYFDANAE